MRIDASGRQQVMLNTIVAELDRTTLENQGINASLALTKIGISLVGSAGRGRDAIQRGQHPNSSSSVGSLSGSSNSIGGILPAGGSIIPLLLSPDLTYGLAAQNSNVFVAGILPISREHTTSAKSLPSRICWPTPVRRPNFSRAARFRS